MCISGSDTCSEFQCPKSVIKGHLQSNVLHGSQAHRPNLNSLSPPNSLLVLLDPSCLLFLLSASTRKHRNHPRQLSCPHTLSFNGPLDAIHFNHLNSFQMLLFINTSLTAFVQALLLFHIDLCKCFLTGLSGQFHPLIHAPHCHHGDAFMTYL